MIRLFFSAQIHFFFQNFVKISRQNPWKNRNMIIEVNKMTDLSSSRLILLGHLECKSTKRWLMRSLWDSMKIACWKKFRSHAAESIRRNSTKLLWAELAWQQITDETWTLWFACTFVWTCRWESDGYYSVLINPKLESALLHGIFLWVSRRHSTRIIWASCNDVIRPFSFKA